ncbi:hypothetical protein DPMN_041152 [Dreissena polymorpha]|uniref:Uncharacterized protein n=1 Tax=Dreissena polymorpha TaxID=45954 RepID=A0A9D4HVY6_DREPO|nr:hypothetical protein DPMN_041152 [Dreissena polymorpha]
METFEPDFFASLKATQQAMVYCAQSCQGHIHSKVSKVTEMSLAQADRRDQKRELTYITKGDLCPD